MQDVKDGLLRYELGRVPDTKLMSALCSVLKHGNLQWNYGALPQTWEAPQYDFPGLKGLKGDEDPVDVVEIGESVHKVGDVVKVKVLGAFCLIDQGEADWKLVTINTDDPLAAAMHSKSLCQDCAGLSHTRRRYSRRGTSDAWQAR